jgi:hypothetical protein
MPISTLFDVFFSRDGGKRMMSPITISNKYTFTHTAETARRVVPLPLTRAPLTRYHAAGVVVSE